MLNGDDVTTIHVINIHHTDTCMVQYTGAGCDLRGDRPLAQCLVHSCCSINVPTGKKGDIWKTSVWEAGVMRWGRQYIESDEVLYLMLKTIKWCGHCQCSSQVP